MFEFWLCFSRNLSSHFSTYFHNEKGSNVDISSSCSLDHHHLITLILERFPKCSHNQQHTLFCRPDQCNEMMVSFLLALLIVCCCASLAAAMPSKERYVQSSGICKNVCVVGATHGNELHGVYFVDEFNHPDVANEMKEKYPTIDLKSIIANPYAVLAAGTGAGLRYCEVDLNRCFLVKDLTDPSITTIEGIRAKEIDQELGPKASVNPRTDFIFDIHSSTSNTGILLCCHPDDKFAWQLVAYLQHKYPKEITACLWSEGEVPLLPSVARSGMTGHLPQFMTLIVIVILSTLTQPFPHALLLTCPLSFSSGSRTHCTFYCKFSIISTYQRHLKSRSCIH